MAEIGNPNSVSDAAVGALAATAGVRGAFLNVKINSSGLDDKAFVEKVLTDGARVVEKTQALEKEIIEMAEKKM
jgi:glutamate formiminotransferase/formiminotetrahydrofolate cyclodeaminase